MRDYTSTKRNEYYEKAMKLYFGDGVPATHICKILPICRTSLYNWIAIFAEENPQVASMRRKREAKKETEPQQEVSVEDIPVDVQELQAELKELRAQLTKAEIKAEAYDELIKVAEAKFNIQIRKKAGAKQ